MKTTTWEPALFKEMFHYAIPNFVTTLIYTFITSTDIVILTLLKGVRDVGIYSVVVPIATISNIVLAPVNTFFIPLISHLMVDEKEKVQKIIDTAFNVIPFVGLYFALFIILFPTQPIRILFGEKWIDIVKIPLIFLSIAFIGTQTANFLTIIIIGLGEVKSRMKASVVIAIVNVLVSIILINKLSVIGAIMASVITFCISIYLFSKIINKTLKVRFPTILYAKLISISALIYIVVKALNLQFSSTLLYVTAGVLYTILFGAIALHLNIFDKSILKTLLKN